MGPSVPDDASLWVDPQLATATARRVFEPGWIFERKLDGVRALVIRAGGVTRLFSRNRNDVSHSYPEIVAAIDDQVGGETFVLDGEIVAFDGDQTSFSRLQRRIHLTDPAEIVATDVPVWFYGFDLLHFDGLDSRALTQLDRKELLRTVADWTDALVFCEHHTDAGAQLLAQAQSAGWEGILAKRADATYRSGRSGSWLKLKLIREQEFVVGGFTEPAGSRQGLGALLLGYHEADGAFRYAGKVGTGFGANALRDLHAQLSRSAVARPAFADPPRERGATWVRPELVVQIAFGEWTPAGHLRHPSFKGIRSDKAPSEVTRET